MNAHPKPRPLAIRLLNEVAELEAGLNRIGYPAERIGRVVEMYAEMRLAPRPAIAPGQSLRWRDGGWIAVTAPAIAKETLMPRISDMIPSKWLAAADLDDAGDHYTITDVRQEEVAKGEYKWIVFFAETTKGLVLNKVNTRTIGQLLGDDTDDWLGHKITLFPTQVDFQGQTVDAIRVRNRLPKPPKPAAPAKASGVGKPARPMTQAEADAPDDDECPF